MKTTTGFLYVGLFAVGSLVALGACGDDETTTSTTTTASASATSGGSGGDTSSSSTTGGGGMGGSGGGMADACTKYCTDIMKTCKDANAQYASEANCMESCKALPATGMDGAMQGNTIQCRQYHVGVAGSSAAMADMHCTHAGPGGDGLCGMNCEGFCSIAVATCNAEWKDMASCMDAMTGCPAFKDDKNVKYVAPTAAGDTFECRLYHLTVATSDAATHCPHTVLMSADPMFPCK
jgi:hypothetical protein